MLSIEIQGLLHEWDAATLCPGDPMKLQSLLAAHRELTIF